MKIIIDLQKEREKEREDVLIQLGQYMDKGWEVLLLLL